MKTLVKPNFFFVGAPKCGTTSIAYYLAKHPNIFITNPKEPHFFEEEIPRGIKSLKVYESFFSTVKSIHKVVGEASTGYLYSKNAIKKIISYSPKAKFLVALRNPYEMAISLHGHALRGRYENEINFSTAWKLQEKRKMGLDIPKSCISNLLLLYEARSALGDQLERLYNTVENDKVFLVFYDDLKANPGLMYEHILEFLELPAFSISEFPVLNKKIDLRWSSLSKLMVILGKIKRRLGIYRSLGFANKVIRATAKQKTDTPFITDEVWKDMDKKFSLQISKIENLSGRDLSHWYHFRI